MLLDEYLQSLKSNKCRGCVVVIGDEQWINFALVNCLVNINVADKNIRYVGDKVSELDPSIVVESVDERSYRSLLGTESSLVIYQQDDIQPDMLAALSGTIVAGGILCLCFSATTFDNNRYMQRFYRELQADKSVLWLKQSDSNSEATLANEQALALPKASLLEVDSDGENSNTLSKFHCLTSDQEMAVAAILKVVTGHRKRPLTLVADRGRGKTTALALACIELLINSKHDLHIVITAPQIGSLASFFTALKKYFPEASIDKTSIQYLNHTIEFIPLDLLTTTPVNASLLLVDEAASLPLYLLEKLLQSFSRIVFASTLHGYEGAGRGFAIKHNALHEKHGLPINVMSLNMPIRWAKTDLLEPLINRACLLNAELTQLPNIEPEALTKLEYRVICQQSLVNDEALLRQVFSVLVTAHYQTTPSDLKLLLNHHKLVIVAMFSGVHLLAVTLMIHEGDIEQDVIAGIKLGQRRVKDQFTPQSLLSHCGINNAFDYNYWRIMRIAVHPSVQNLGIGTLFLQKIEADARAKGVDILATSFGLNNSLAKFWLGSDWQIARIGFTRDHCSGEHSGLLLKPLSATSHSFIKAINQQFYQSFSFLLADQYQALNTELVTKILFEAEQSYFDALTDIDKQLVKDFSLGAKEFDVCAYSLHKWLLNICAEQTIKLDIDNAKVLSMLIARLLQKQPIASVLLEYQLTGKKALMLAFRQFVSSVN